MSENRSGEPKLQPDSKKLLTKGGSQKPGNDSGKYTNKSAHEKRKNKSRSKSNRIKSRTKEKRMDDVITPVTAVVFEGTKYLMVQDPFHKGGLMPMTPSEQEKCLSQNIVAFGPIYLDGSKERDHVFHALSRPKDACQALCKCGRLLKDNAAAWKLLLLVMLARVLDCFQAEPESTGKSSNSRPTVRKTLEYTRMVFTGMPGSRKCCFIWGFLSRKRNGIPPGASISTRGAISRRNTKMTCLA